MNRTHLSNPAFYTAALAAGLTAGCAGLSSPGPFGTGGAMPVTGTTTTTGNGGGNAGGGQHTSPGESTKFSSADGTAATKAPGGSLTQACADRLDAGDTSIVLSVDGTRDMASAEIARGALNLGSSPRPDLVRPQSFLNHYRTVYAGPTDPTKIKVHAALVVPDPNAPREHVLQVAVETPDVLPPRLKASSITVVVDTSTSMAIGGAQSGIARAKKAVKAIADALLPGDHLTVVTSSAGSKPVTIPFATDLQKAIDGIDVDGGTEMAQAMVTAYAAADVAFVAGGINRVVLITDGTFAGDALNLITIADHASQRGVGFVAVGVGPAKSYDDGLLRGAAEAGQGANLYLDSTDAADELLHLRFDEIMDTAAAGVQLKLTVPWFFQGEDLTGSGVAASESTVMKAEVGPGRAIIFRQRLRVCDASLLPLYDTATFPIVVTWTPPGSSTSMDEAPGLTLGNLLPANGLADAFPVMKAGAILEYAEALRGLSKDRLTRAHTSVSTALGATHDHELGEILGLLEKDPIYLAP